jgi:predicted transposase YbfD/YdcC
LLANLVGPMIRDHWMIENGLHWIMDMVFRDQFTCYRRSPIAIEIVRRIDALFEIE